MIYVAKMNSWVHSSEYPITKTTRTKKAAIEYMKRALSIYPYVKITLYKYPTNGEQTKIKTYEAADFFKHYKRLIK